MKPLEEVLQLSTGAKFFRADLHIHSFGGSHDVRDQKMTSAAIIETAIQERLSIISITDHNEISNASAAIEAAKNKPVYVVPGVELSTSQGHLLCYLPSLENLQRFYGQLTLADRGKQNSRCQQSILECLNLMSPLGGFGILAHVDIQSGFEIEVPGASPHKQDVLCHQALLGIELKHANSPISYAFDDPDPVRASIGKERISRLKLGIKQNLARVLNSDAHALVNLGRNAANAQRVTRYKMDFPSFDGLRVALEDADARTRIEDQIPQTVPRILGIHIDGGFLSRQAIQFSYNLNCIIGGRGTGKSTMFEAVRCLVETDSDPSKVVDSEVWPEQLHLFWQDRAGQIHTLSRLKGNELCNVDSPDDGPCSFEIDCFGQGEAQKISLQAQTDPLALSHYLDRFMDLKVALEEETKARDRLLELQTRIEHAEQQVALIPQHQRLLNTAKQQLTALQKPDVKELIDLNRKLASERGMRAEILLKLQEAKECVRQSLPSNAIDGITELAEEEPLAIGATEFTCILAGAAELKKVLGTAEDHIKTGLSAFERVVTTQLVNWKAKEVVSQKKIDDKRRELESQKIAFDLAYIAKLAKDEATYTLNVKNLTTWKPVLAATLKLRESVLKERWIARDRIATIRESFGKQATKTLRESLTDIQVSLKYARNAHSPEASIQIIQAMGWRTNQQSRADWLVETLTIPILLEAINNKDSTPILALRTPENTVVFERDEAEVLLERLGESTIKFALERAMLYDLARLQVARARQDGQGGTRRSVREFTKLSLGQQQSVLLALMLSVNSDKPLIIDQPEDNLDGEFIYSTLVPVLRRAKERRQVIIVTHNPNIAVLGDAEQLVVMKALNDSGIIISRGSIDHPETRESACGILEGAREAFLRRAKMYVVSLP